jgi:hypothetical protein
VIELEVNGVPANVTVSVPLYPWSVASGTLDREPD